MAPLHADEPDVKARIEQQAAGLKEQGIDADVRFESIILGGPARSIADVAKETGADLIVVGTRGHSALAGVFLGSVTLKLLHLGRLSGALRPEAARGGLRRAGSSSPAALPRSSPGGVRRRYRPCGGRPTRTRPR